MGDRPPKPETPRRGDTDAAGRVFEGYVWKHGGHQQVWLSPAAFDRRCAKAKANTAEWVKKNPKRMMLAAARCRADAAGVPFAIGECDIDIPERCPALGIPLAVSNTGQAEDSSPSLDRIVPHLGYVPGNVVVVSHLANRIKTNATTEQVYRVGRFYRDLGHG
jgi:hypothetical protein